MLSTMNLSTGKAGEASMRTNHSKRSSTLSPTERLPMGERKNDLLKFMSKVGVLDRDILARKFLQEMSSEEIAKEMGLIARVVDDRIYHAAKQLGMITE